MCVEIQLRRVRDSWRQDSRVLCWWRRSSTRPKVAENVTLICPMRAWYQWKNHLNNSWHALSHRLHLNSLLVFILTSESAESEKQENSAFKLKNKKSTKGCVAPAAVLSNWSMKYRSRSPGQDVQLVRLSMWSIMQRLVVLGLIGDEIGKVYVKYVNVNGEWNICQCHWIEVTGWGGQGDSSYKVWWF